MKVAIDSGPLGKGHSIRGVGVHIRELTLALSEWVKNKKDIEVELMDFSNSDLSGFNILHYQFFHPFFISLPIRKQKAKVIATIHDLIPLIYPKHYPGGIKGKMRLWINKWLIKRNVDIIITISETSKKDICRFLKVKPEKVNVIYLAPRKIFKPITDNTQLKAMQTKFGLPDTFVLYVGDINYNKNIPNLIKACKLAKIPLVICGKQAFDIETLGVDDLSNLKGPRDWIRYLFGKPHPELAHYQELCREFGENRKVLRLGYVSDEDLVSIYSLASVYCQPSFYEGFGLPVLEAFACGTPVVASKTQALVEIAEGGALFADPHDPKEIAVQITKIIKDGKIKEQLIKKGFAIAKKFSWEKAAKETIDVYRAVINT
ncbi:MAG: glycosyltransferase family 1 protein [bacterium]